MNASTTVSLHALRTSVNRLLDEIERRRGDEIDLGADFYWVLPASSAYDLDAPPIPGAHTTGSLVDDLATVRELSADTDEDADVVVWHDLAHLLGVLQRLAALDLPHGD